MASLPPIPQHSATSATGTTGSYDEGPPTVLPRRDRRRSSVAIGMPPVVRTMKARVPRQGPAVPLRAFTNAALANTGVYSGVGSGLGGGGWSTRVAPGFNGDANAVPSIRDSAGDDGGSLKRKSRVDGERASAATFAVNVTTDSESTVATIDETEDVPVRPSFRMSIVDAVARTNSVDENIVPDVDPDSISSSFIVEKRRKPSNLLATTMESIGATLTLPPRMSSIAGQLGGDIEFHRSMSTIGYTVPAKEQQPEYRKEAPAALKPRVEAVNSTTGGAMAGSGAGQHSNSNVGGTGIEGGHEQLRQNRNSTNKPSSRDHTKGIEGQMMEHLATMRRKANRAKVAEIILAVDAQSLAREVTDIICRPLRTPPPELAERATQIKFERNRLKLLGKSPQESSTVMDKRKLSIRQPGDDNRSRRNTSMSVHMMDSNGPSADVSVNTDGDFGELDRDVFISASERARHRWIYATTFTRKMIRATRVFIRNPDPFTPPIELYETNDIESNGLTHLLKSHQSKADIVFSSRVQAMLAGERTPQVLRTLQRLLSFRLKGFSKFKPEQQRELCAVLQYESRDAGSVIVKEGHDPIGYYFVLSGQCEVYKTKKNKKYRTNILNVGDFYGEDRSEGKHEYDLILHMNDSENIASRLVALQQIPHFQSTQQSVVERIAQISQLHTYQPQEIIVTEGVENYNIFFIITGSCRAVKLVPFIRHRTTPKWARHSVRHALVAYEPGKTAVGPQDQVIMQLLTVKELGPGDHFPDLLTEAVNPERFNRIELMTKLSSDGPNHSDARSYVSVIATTKLEVISMTRVDYARMATNDMIQRVLADRDLLHVPISCLQEAFLFRRSWEIFKKKSIIELVKVVCMKSATAITSAWDTLFSNPLLNIDTIRERGVRGKIDDTSLRSLYWKIFLEYLPSLETDAWLVVLQKERHGYEDLKRRFLFDPSKQYAENLDVNNPLSLAEESPWSQYFKDTELVKVIKQDVERTMPEQAYFRDPDVQELMVNILFVWSKLNPDVSYRQGMHEILAPILLVVDSDKADPLQVDRLEPLQAALFDANFVEHDASMLFYRVMRVTKPWFEAGQDSGGSSASARARAAKLGQFDEIRTKVLPIVAECQKIQNDLLRVLDPELYQHLEKLNIEPQLYGLRWLRLLFGREFALPDLLVLWDGLFADDPNLSLVDWMCVALLVFLRRDLINSDYSSTLHKLMKFPPMDQLNTSVPEFIASAKGCRSRFNHIAIAASKSTKVVDSDVPSTRKANQTDGNSQILRQGSTTSSGPAEMSADVSPTMQEASSNPNSAKLALLESRIASQWRESQRIKERDKVLAKKIESCLAVIREFVDERKELEGVFDELKACYAELGGSINLNAKVVTAVDNVNGSNPVVVSTEKTNIANAGSSDSINLTSASVVTVKDARVDMRAPSRQRSDAAIRSAAAAMFSGASDSSPPDLSWPSPSTAVIDLSATANVVAGSVRSMFSALSSAVGTTASANHQAPHQPPLSSMSATKPQQQKVDTTADIIAEGYRSTAALSPRTRQSFPPPAPHRVNRANDER